MGIKSVFLEGMGAETGCIAGWRKVGMDRELGVHCRQ